MLVLLEQFQNTPNPSSCKELNANNWDSVYSETALTEPAFIYCAVWATGTHVLGGTPPQELQVLGYAPVVSVAS